MLAGSDRDPGVGGQVEAGLLPLSTQEPGIEDDLPGVVQVVRRQYFGGGGEVLHLAGRTWYASREPTSGPNSAGHSAASVGGARPGLGKRYATGMP